MKPQFIQWLTATWIRSILYSGKKMSPAQDNGSEVMQKITSQQHHQKAAEHREYASEHHKEAAMYCKSGDQKATAHNNQAEAYHTRMAHEHTAQAMEQEVEDGKKCADTRSLKT